MADEKILLVDDDIELTTLISSYLSSNGFECQTCHDGEKALNKISVEKPDILVLDLMLPGIDGLSICRQVRDQFDGPILMLTALDDDIDEVTGLEVGADDYLTKPVKPRVLLAHLRAQLRRYSRSSSNSDSSVISIRQGELTIDPGTREVKKAGNLIDLTSAEFELLWLLAESRGKTVDREYLYQKIYRLEFDGLDRTIDLRVSKLRKKLGSTSENQPFIVTVRSIGYQLAD